MTATDGLIGSLLMEVLRDSHSYAPGIDQHRPTLLARPRPRELTARGREHTRDLVERAAGRAGFHRRHFDPELAARALERVIELSGGLEATYARLGDDRSRRTMLDVLKLRVLGPHHAPLTITPQAYREKQRFADSELRTEAATFHVSDPWFSPLSRYTVAADGAPTLMLHGHSVDVVSVFLLGQYGYSAAGGRVRAEPGDVVLDAGGCWGDTALYFASLVGPAGRVYTFEFNPESLEILRANLALNPELAERIEVVELALWDRSGDKLEFAQAGRMTALVPDGGDETHGVSTITIDDFVEQQGLDRVDFVKMDVEGAELNLLRGAGQSIARFAPKLGLAAYHKDDDLVTIPEQVVALRADYELYLGSFSALEDETVLFAAAPRATSLSSRT